MSPSPQQAIETRQRILEVAIEEIHRVGFDSASINSILNVVGLTKGAFYHHFTTKKELGLAVIRDGLASHIRELWIDPIAAKANPIDGFIEHMFFMKDELDEKMIRCGCPLNNLSQELSTKDEEMRIAISDVYTEWVNSYEDVFKRGQENGTVTSSIEAKSIALFLVTWMEGTIGLVKTHQSKTILDELAPSLIYYLESLRPKENP